MVSTNNLFGFEQIEAYSGADATFIFEEIHKELEEYLPEKSINADSAGGLPQEDFDEVIGEDTDKKRFVKALTRIFAILLKTKVDTADKIKRILKIAVETTLKIWQGPK